MNDVATPPADAPGAVQAVARLTARWWWIAAGVLCGAVIGVAVASLLPKRYEGRATLLVSPSKLNPEGVQETLSVDAYVELVRSAAVAQRIATQFDITRIDGLGALQFLQRRVVVRQVRGTQVIEVTVQLGDPARAAAVANAFVQEAVRLVEARTSSEASAAIAGIGAQLQEARRRLDAAQARLLETRSASQVELVEKDSTSLLAERGKLLSLDVDIAAEQGRIATLTAQLSNTPETLTVARALDRSTAMLEANRQGQGSTPLDVTMNEQLLNPAYHQIQEALTSARSRLAALEQSRQRMRGQMRLAGDSLPRLNELYRSQAAVDRLKAEYEIAIKAYTEIAQEHELAAVRVMTRTATLQVVDAALPPDKAASPSRLVFAVAGGLIVAIGAGALALVRPLAPEA